MKTIELNPADLEAVTGGDFAYDVGRLVRFFFLCGNGYTVPVATADWAATQAMNEAKAK